MNAQEPVQPARDDTTTFAAAPARIAGGSTATSIRVATSVWRLDDRDGAAAATRPGARFVSRLARRLVLTYTRRNDAIIDFDGDMAFGAAAGATTRVYVALTKRHRITELDRLIRPASLTILRWPRPALVATDTSIDDLLLACQFIAATAPSLLAIVSMVEAQDTSTRVSPQVGMLLGAATKARFIHQERILAFASPSDGDTYTYYPNDTDVDAALDAWRSTARPGIRVDILRHATPGRDNA